MNDEKEERAYVFDGDNNKSIVIYAKNKEEAKLLVPKEGNWILKFRIHFEIEEDDNNV